MKKGFPHRFLGVPIGWKSIGNYYGNDVECPFCHGEKLFNKYLAREGSKTFKYCAHCLVIIEEVKNAYDR